MYYFFDKFFDIFFDIFFHFKMKNYYRKNNKKIVRKFFDLFFA